MHTTKSNYSFINLLSLRILYTLFRCESCLLLRKTITRLHLIITENKTIPNDLRNRFMFRLKHSETLIVEWKKHQIRSVHQAGALNQVLNELDDKSVLLITDWAMKFLPQRYREAQREFFGKRGLPWHLTYVIHRKSYSDPFSASSGSSFASSSSSKNQPFEHQTFCHISDNCTQNCRSVVTVIANVRVHFIVYHELCTFSFPSLGSQAIEEFSSRIDNSLFTQ